MRTRATLQRSGASRRVPARNVERPRRTETGSSAIARLDGERRHDEVEPASYLEREALRSSAEPVTRLTSSLEPPFEMPVTEDVVDRQIGQLPGLVEPPERPFGPLVAPPREVEAIVGQRVALGPRVPHNDRRFEPDLATQGADLQRQGRVLARGDKAFVEGSDPPQRVHAGQQAVWLHVFGPRPRELRQDIYGTMHVRVVLVETAIPHFAHDAA